MLKRSFIQRFNAAIDGFFGYSPVKEWSQKHPKLSKKLRDHLTTKQFTGLPLTLLAIAFIFIVASALGIAQDYLAHDPLVLADARIANLLYAFRGTTLLSFFYGVTLFGEASIAIVAAVVLSAVLWYKRQRVLAVGIWLALISSEGTTYVAKILFHRDRPSFRAVVEDSFSFPSGHATTVTVFYGFLAYLALRKVKAWKTRFVIILGFVALVVLVDLSRMYLGVHYLSDVVAGNLVGLAGLLFAVTTVEYLSEKRFTVDWKKFSLKYLLPSAVSIGIVVIVLFAKAPAFTVQGERPSPQPLPDANVLSIFAEGGLPKYSETLIGEEQEPIQMIIIGQEQCFGDAFSRAGWLLADKPTWSSVEQVAVAALRNTRYPTAPMTPSFFNALPNDYGFERETEEQTARERHHARFWDTGYASPDGEVYVGTASLDVGIKWGITHRIAPDIDTERSILVTDLKNVGVISDTQTVPFVSPILGTNFSGDQFFTDGEAVVLKLSPCE